MKKRNSKKGFTLVELVIVIAVIAILAGVLIPTFGNVIEKANASACQQEAANLWKEIYARFYSEPILKVDVPFYASIPSLSLSILLLYVVILKYLLLYFLCGI